MVALVMGQLVFCGGFFPLAGRAGLEQFSLLLPARAGYAAMASTVGVQPGAEPDRLFEPTATQWAWTWACWGRRAWSCSAWPRGRSRGRCRAPARAGSQGPDR